MCCKGGVGPEGQRGEEDGGGFVDCVNGVATDVPEDNSSMDDG
jgi:hypothetical protein